MKRIALAVMAMLSSVSASAETVVITAARMLDVASGKIIDKPIIVVEDGRIARVSTQDQLPIIDGPTGKARIDLGDLTILPGLINMHVHLTSDPALGFRADLDHVPAYFTAVGVAMAGRTLDAGFTTVRIVGSAEFKGGVIAKDTR